jgi:hypothetical protein
MAQGRLDLVQVPTARDVTGGPLPQQDPLADDQDR